MWLDHFKYLLTEFEGLKLKVYLVGNSGNLTLGYGTELRNCPPTYRNLKKDAVITLAQANECLDYYLSKNNFSGLAAQFKNKPDRFVAGALAILYNVGTNSPNTIKALNGNDRSERELASYLVKLWNDNNYNNSIDYRIISTIHYMFTGHILPKINHITTKNVNDALFSLDADLYPPIGTESISNVVVYSNVKKKSKNNWWFLIIPFLLFLIYKYAKSKSFFRRSFLPNVVIGFLCTLQSLL